MHDGVDSGDHRRKQWWFAAVVVQLAVFASVPNQVDRVPRAATATVPNLDQPVDGVGPIFHQRRDRAPATTVVGAQKSRLSLATGDRRDPTGRDHHHDQDQYRISRSPLAPRPVILTHVRLLALRSFRPRCRERCVAASEKRSTRQSIRSARTGSPTARPRCNRKRSRCCADEDRPTRRSTA